MVHYLQTWYRHGLPELCTIKLPYTAAGQPLTSSTELYERPENAFVAQFISANNKLDGQGADLSWRSHQGSYDGVWKRRIYR